MNSNLICVLVFLIACLSDICHASRNERALVSKLFRNYDKLRPVEFDDEVLDVNLALNFQHLLDIDEEKNTIEFVGLLELRWNDYSLKWNPEDYENLTALRVPSKLVWIPDIVLFNSASDSFAGSQQTVNVYITNTGTVVYIQPGVSKIICDLKQNVDEQNCKIIYGSWTYDDKGIKLVKQRSLSEVSNSSSYKTGGNKDWTFILNEPTLVVNKYECCPNDSFPSIQYDLVLKKKPSAPTPTLSDFFEDN